MSLLVTIRTADRSPKKNYLGRTVRALLEQGYEPHIYPTDADMRWLNVELEGFPQLSVHPPWYRSTPNENGIRQVSLLDTVVADWLLMLEDDIEVCADFIGSVSRWLTDHADPAIHVYRLHALPQTPLKRIGPAAALAPLREMRGSQAVALRAEDARLFAAWATAHPKDWRPKSAPFQQWPDRGFDKLIGYWALQQWPDQPDGLVSLPMLVNHLGRESMLHTHGLRNDAHFAGASWRYQGTA